MYNHKGVIWLFRFFSVTLLLEKRDIEVECESQSQGDCFGS